MLRPPGFMWWNKKMEIGSLHALSRIITPSTGGQDMYYRLTAPAACKSKTHEHNASKLKVIQRHPGRMKKKLFFKTEDSR